MGRQIKARVPEQVQTFAITWLEPYRVACMSITSAFGFDKAYFAKGCRPYRPSVYFESDTGLRHVDLGVRPAMLVAGATASYGTVVEPCYFPEKFPHAEVAMHRYLAGDTALEAYSKSVRWPDADADAGGLP